MQNLQANKNHALVSVKLAMAPEVSDGDDIADRLNIMLGKAVEEHLIADFKFTNTAVPVLAQASENPVENELFKQHPVITALMSWLECNVEEGTPIYFDNDDEIHSEDVLKALMAEGYTS